MLPLLATLGLAYAAKKVYDALSTDDEAPDTTNRHDAEEKSRRKEAERREALRAQRLHERTERVVARSLDALGRDYLGSPVLPVRFSPAALERFTDCTIECPNSAEAALTALCGKSVQLQVLPTQAEHHAQEIRALQQLEKLIRKV